VNPQVTAAFFGCTVEQARAGYLKGAVVLDQMADKAERTGRKVGGYTVAELRAKAADQRRRAAL
jgi:hypothetical protein